jgi:multimeric flavodoxin WrbA
VSVLVILGSARGEGDTIAIVDAVFENRASTRIDLRELQIRQYAYDRAPDGDAVLSIADAMIEHDTIVFATPVYWYAMSGLMKVLSIDSPTSSRSARTSDAGSEAEESS